MTTISNPSTIRFEPHSAAPGEFCVICRTDFESQEPNAAETTTLAHAIEKTHHVFHQNCLEGFFNAQLSRGNPTLCPTCMQLADPSSVCMQPADPSSVLSLSEFRFIEQKAMTENAIMATTMVILLLGYTIFGFCAASRMDLADDHATITSIAGPIISTIELYSLAHCVYLQGGPRDFFAELWRPIAEFGQRVAAFRRQDANPVPQPAAFQ